MAYRKFRADRLFDGYTMLDSDQVLITSTDGIVEAIVPDRDAGEGVQVFTGILSPGFVNCHCHLELSHMRGRIAEGTGLADFVFSVVSQRHFAEDLIREAIAKAETEMLENGIVAIGDICNNTLTIDQKKGGKLLYHNFIESSGFNPATAGIRFQQSLDCFSRYSEFFTANSIVPHAPYSVANELWEKIIDFAPNKLLTIHNQETPAEDELFMTGKGDFLRLYEKMGIDISYFRHPVERSVRSYLKKFKDHQSVILVHNVCTTDDDLSFANSSGRKITWCFCPNANLYISKQLPAIDHFTQYSDQLVLGTDSLASNHQLSILAEINTIRRYFPAINIHQLFRWATSNGAKALQMDKLLGSFERGKRPGVILVDDGLVSVKRLL